MSFGSVFKRVTNAVKGVVVNAAHNPIQTAGIVASIATGNPVFAAAGSAAQTKVNGGSNSEALVSGATSYATSAIGNAAGNYAASQTAGSAVDLSTKVGSIANGAGSVGPQSINLGIGDIIGQQTSNAIGARVANASVGSILGSTGAFALQSTAKSGSDVSAVDSSTSNSTTSTNINTGADTKAADAPTIGDTAVQQTGNDVARAAAEAKGKTASIISDQSDSDVTDGNPNILKRKSLLSD